MKAHIGTSRTTRYAVSAAVWLVLAAVVALPAAAAEGPFAITPGSFATEVSTNQAGAHPDLTTRFKLDVNPDGTPVGGVPRNLNVVLPKGLIGSPTATPTCPIGVTTRHTAPFCPLDAAVGKVHVLASYAGQVVNLHELVYSINPYPGEPAAFAFLAVYPVRLDTYVRPDGDYGVTATATDLTEGASVTSADLTLWGVPPDHNGPGLETDANSQRIFGGPSGNPRVPFLTNPTECSGNPLDSSISVDTWQKPVQTATADYSFGPISGCDQLEFDPTIDAKPTTDLADAPSGLDFNLHVPQHHVLVGANEVQSMSVEASEGEFRLGFGGEATPDLPFYANNGEIQTALQSLTSIGAGNVAVSGGRYFDFAGGLHDIPFEITFEGALAHTDVQQIAVEPGTNPLQGSATIVTSLPGSPAGTAAEELATSHLRDAVVKFPPGMTVNPSSANGLQACTLAQVGMLASGRPQGSPVACPNASKLGTVEAVSPAIGHPLPGAIYLAKQSENPFNSLLATYLVIDDPLSGVLVKLAGKVEPDPATGQLTASFKNNPQLPVEDLSLHLFSGPQAALRTPGACGTHTTTSTLTPWSAPSIPDATPSSSFELTNGPDGGACLPDGAGAPNKPTFTAGTLNPTAKAFSPFVFKLTRQDGSQPFKAIEATLPKGLLGKLAGIPYCPDAALAAAANKSGKAEQASSSCPAASQVGTVNVGAGAGSTPFYASGKAYLAGPYKGAPLSLAIVTPAVAGPFDLGTVVIRNALQIDPETAQVHAVSDPIPTILQGIPLDIRSIAVNLDKPNFTLNPTNCSPSAVLGNAVSVFNQSAALSDPFQVGDCGRLPFKPSLAIKLKGGTSRSDHPALTATLKARPGDANIAATSVALPHSEILAQEHIRTVCTRVQFAAGAGNGAGCPKGSIYGKASVTSPLVDQPLSGPVYLRSSSNPLPDLVVALHGQIDVNLVGRIDSKNGGIRTSFDSVPDAPVTKFVLQMQGGKKGLLVNSRDLCRTTNKADVDYSAQNGAGYSAAPVVGNSCKGKAHKKKAKKTAKRHGRR